ncbi:O-antigen ligase family protein [Reinekea sp.]|jgi:O-antigen ligase|uniref:O-antigen ligase family protein n=1 Tax=Reinekea sp. TaxID=1970455 RepID=UPI002A820E54|nr:O-antigen ligase family protein [Reinekea sp.]
MSPNLSSFRVEDFYFLKVSRMWRYFWSEHPALWCLCAYVFFEYFRPQSIYPIIDILPWAQGSLLLAIAFSVFDKKSKTNWTMSHTLLAVFALQILISFVFAYDVVWSKKNYIDFFQWVVVFIAITRVVTTPERLYIAILVYYLCALKIALGTAYAFALRGFAFTNWGLKGPPGYFENSGELSILMLTLLALNIFLLKMHFRHNAGKTERAVLLLGVVCPILVIIGASSRGAQLALLCALIGYFLKNAKSLKYILFGMLLSLLCFKLLPEQQKIRFTNAGNDETSEQRLLYWKRGYEMIKEHPFVGVGFYNFVPYFVAYYPDDLRFRNQNGKLQAEYPHNIFIQVGTDAGVFALLTYILFITITIRNSLLVGTGISIGLGFGVILYVVAGQFVSVAYYPFLWVSASLITASHQIALTQQR